MKTINAEMASGAKKPSKSARRAKTVGRLTEGVLGMDTSNRRRREDYEPSPIEPDYPKTNYVITQQAPERAAWTGEVAGHLLVSAGTATSMFSRLAHSGLLRHEFYRGVRVTAAEWLLANCVLRHQQVVKTFLARVLVQSGLDINVEAERLKHAVSENLLRGWISFCVEVSPPRSWGAELGTHSVACAGGARTLDSRMHGARFSALHGLDFDSPKTTSLPIHAV